MNRREIGRTVLVNLARDNAAGQLLDELANLRVRVIDRMRRLASEIEPEPASLSVFGSFARAEAEAGSDIDLLAVRRPDVDGELWATSLTRFGRRTRALTGNPVEVIDYDLEELRLRRRRRSVTPPNHRSDPHQAGSCIGTGITNTSLQFLGGIRGSRVEHSDPASPDCG